MRLQSLILFLLISISFYSCKGKEDEGAKKDKIKHETAAIQESEEITHPVQVEREDASGQTGNNPPLVNKIKLQPQTTNNRDELKVIAEGLDKDEDEITFKYEWTKNNEPVGTGDTISGFKKGDKLSVKITPFDGKDYGQPRIMATEINNSTPKIIEHKEIGFDGGLLTYQVKAIDADGDSLSYTLLESPAGMTIDNTTGVIKWQTNPDTSGKHTVKVKVSDGEGGELDYTFEINIGEGEVN